MFKVKNIEQLIINSVIKKEGGGLPYNFYKIDKLPYTFTKPALFADEDGAKIYSVDIELVNINGFYYPAQIFTGESTASKNGDYVSLTLKDKYEIYGASKTLEASDPKGSFEELKFTKTFYLNFNVNGSELNMFVDKKFFDTSNANSTIADTKK